MRPTPLLACLLAAVALAGCTRGVADGANPTASAGIPPA